MDAKTIRDMLQAVRAERKRIADRDDVLEEREETLLEWLKEETPEQAALPLNGEDKQQSASPLSRFLERALATGVKQTTDELVVLAQADPEVAEKYLQPAKAINFTLQGWKHFGRVHQDAGKRWFMKGA